MGLADYLGWDWQSSAGIPLVCVPGCPVQPDNFMEVVLYLLNQAAGRAPMIPLDCESAPDLAVRRHGARRLRPRRLLRTSRLRRPLEAGSPKCIVKLGCWGPVVQCNVGKRGWMNGIGGCPNVGGVCIGCTMPGFPDKFMPFLEEPPGAQLSTTAVVMYGKTVRALRNFTRASLNREPEWRQRDTGISQIGRTQHSLKPAKMSGKTMLKNQFWDATVCHWLCQCRRVSDIASIHTGRASGTLRRPPASFAGASACIADSTVDDFHKDLAIANVVRSKPPAQQLVEMSWDPITRIVGSLGIYTKIDFATRRVAECYSTSSIFRGYSVFMKGKDPRDAHFITSRICGICGDNHATCACYAQNMAFGIHPPPLAEWIINLGEAAEYMFDHCLYQDNLVGVDFCEQMVRETNPSVLARAEKTPAAARRAARLSHDRRHHAGAESVRGGVLSAKRCK